jgi:MoxR-like ATPase
MEQEDIIQLQEKIALQSVYLEQVQQEIGKNIIGQKYMIERLLIALLSNGHVLLEGAPGLAKTLAIRSLAEAIKVDFSRVQFTPDLLPADIIGTMIYNASKGDFEAKKGPIFANFILADEINRAPAKVQSALLQAMQERQVTLGDTTYKLPTPFLVMATQNPIEQEGTYTLPEAQVDRFMLKVIVDYPSFEEERVIMRQHLNNESPKLNPVITANQLLDARQLVEKIYMDENIEKYILNIIFATRQPEKYGLSKIKDLILYGASPRATISMAIAAKAHAFLKHRAYVIPEDIKAIAHDVLRHRIGLSFEAEAESITSTHLIDSIFTSVQAP